MINFAAYWFAYHRKRLHLTQHFVAWEMKVSSSLYSQWEQGNRSFNPKLETLVSIARVFGKRETLKLIGFFLGINPDDIYFKEKQDESIGEDDSHYYYQKNIRHHRKQEFLFKERGRVWPTPVG